MDLDSLKGLGILVMTFGFLFAITGSRLMRVIDSIEAELNKKRVVTRSGTVRLKSEAPQNDEPQVCDDPSQVRAEAQEH